MKFQLFDIVFQNDRYYLLFNDAAATSIVSQKLVWKIIVDGDNNQNLEGCKISEEIQVDDRIILETFQNLSKLENVFRKTRSVMITADSGSI